MTDTRLSTFGPRPFGAPKPVGKAPVFKGGKTSTKPAYGENSPKLPTVRPIIPGVSSDSLKDKLASMKRTPPPLTPNETESRFKEQNSASFARSSLRKIDRNDASSNELKHKGNSMTTSDNNNENDKDTTPEFLRRRLKPTGKNLNSYEKLPENKQDTAEENNENKQNTNVVIRRTDNSNEDNPHAKLEFRKSIQLFEKAANGSSKKLPPPALKPKPRGDSLVRGSVEGDSLVSGSLEKENASDEQLKTDNTDEESINRVEVQDREINTSNTIAESTAVNDTEKPEVNNEAEMVLDSFKPIEIKPIVEIKPEVVRNPVKGVKPNNLKLSFDIPAGLYEWLTLFVINNGSLKKIEDEILNNLPPPVHRDLKLNDVGIVQHMDKPQSNADESTQPIEEELYDDIEQKTPVDQTPADEELYDDVDGLQKPDVVQEDEELYDDVNSEQLAAITNVSNGITEINFNNESNYEIEVEGIVGDDHGERIYEPVETLGVYMVHDEETRKDSTVDKKISKREEKELKEREKREKREQEEMEKRRKKEEEILEKRRKKEDEERKKREKEERKRIEKERKEFKLNINEEPVVVAQFFVERDCKGKGRDLPLSQGQWIFIISKTNAPKGKWLAQDKEGKLGYVNPKDIGADERKRASAHRPLSIPSVAFGGGGGDDDDDFYEEVQGNSTSSFSKCLASSGFQSTIVTPLSLPGVQEEEELYDDVAKTDDQKEDFYEAI